MPSQNQTTQKEKLALPGVQYTIWPADLYGHRFHVQLRIEIPNPNGQIIQMPAWIPGSYLIRDFSKHIESIKAYGLPENKSGKRNLLNLERLDNDRWKLPKIVSPVEINTIVYAFDSSVRAAYLDDERGFFNPSSLCLAVQGQTDLPCALAIAPPKDILANAWIVKTTLRPVKTDPNGFGFYLAPTYDDLLDHPIAFGQFQTVQWKSRGTLHSISIQGCVGPIDKKRLVKDLQAICNTTIDLFEPKSHKAPFDHYLFLVNTLLSGYGGLEHRNSTALLCRRDQIPQENFKLEESAYREFLGLCSHEYFHAWLVKRIQPKAFQPYHLGRRNLTRLLWIFEGFTSYYDDLQLLRSERLSLKSYFKLVADNWNLVLRGPGREKQSLADSSFDAWTKYYQADENTPNAVVSYYNKGALLALGLDLTIRKFSNGRKSLDDAMRLLWKWHGRTLDGISEDGLDAVILVLLGPEFTKRWGEFKADYIFGCKDIPLEQWFDPHFVKVTPKPLSSIEKIKLLLGLRFVDSKGWLKITHVLDGGAAQLAGIAPGDLLASINGQRICNERWDAVLGTLKLGQRICFRFYRQDVERESEVILNEEIDLQQFQIEPEKTLSEFVRTSIRK